MDKGEKEMKEEINKIKKQNNSVGASKIKSRKFSLFCSRGILDVRRNRIKVNIIPSSLYKVFDNIERLNTEFNLHL